MPITELAYWANKAGDPPAARLLARKLKEHLPPLPGSRVYHQELRKEQDAARRHVVGALGRAVGAKSKGERLRALGDLAGAVGSGPADQALSARHSSLEELRRRLAALAGQEDLRAQQAETPAAVRLAREEARKLRELIGAVNAVMTGSREEIAAVLKSLSDLAAQEAKRQRDAHLAAAQDRIRKAHQAHMAMQTGLKGAKAALGPLLDIRDEGTAVVKKHLADLALAPAGLHQRLKDAGLAGVFVGAVPYPELDDNQRLRGVRPRGWPEGSTWQDVAAGYDPERRMAAVWSAEPTGSASEMLHEYGHAVGHLLEYYDDPRLIAAHRRLYGELLTFYRQGGPGGAAGRSELLAEGFAIYLKKGRQGCVQEYDEGFAAFLDDIITGGEH